MFATGLVVGIAYGIIVPVMYSILIFLVADFLSDNIGPLLDDDEESYELLITVPLLLGGARASLLVMFSFLWPIPVIAYLIFVQQFKNKESLPPIVQKVVNWIFLGFGKFTHEIPTAE